MKTIINKREKIGSVAIQQALRFHFNLKISDICKYARVHQTTVWQNTIVMIGGTLSWEERTRKDEAIAEAAKLINA